LTGPRAGQTFTLAGGPPFVGLISADRETLIAAYLSPGVQIETYSNGNVLHRICTNSQVLIKLKDEENH
jgi:hypothetical protein